MWLTGTRDPMLTPQASEHHPLLARQLQEEAQVLSSRYLVSWGRPWILYILIRIHMFLGYPDPDPLVIGMDPDPDPDPSIVMQKL